MSENLGLLGAAKQAGRAVGLDRAGFFATLASATPLVFGPVTALLVATRLSPELQGYYYTFGSFTFMVSVLEVGLGQSIVQLASHEWSAMRWDTAGRAVGDDASLSRITELGRQSFKWYGGLAGLALGVVGPAGARILASRADTVWVWPWVALCISAAAALAVLPLFALLQGCGRAADFWFYRWIQQIINPLSLWVALEAGARLWAPAIAVAVGMCWSSLFLGCWHRGLLEVVMRRPSTRSAVNWWAEAWPLQWRVAVAWSSVHLTTQMFVPTLFYLSGPIVAGRMGLTLTLVNVLTAASSAWVVPKGPAFGVLVAQQRFQELDDLFKRSLLGCLAVGAVGTSLVWAGVLALGVLGLSLQARVLSPVPAGLLLATSLPTSLTLAVSTYFRAHKREPLAPVLLTSGVGTLVMAILLGPRWGAPGVAGGYLVILLVYQLPSILVILRRSRTKWHGRTAAH